MHCQHFPSYSGPQVLVTDIPGKPYITPKDYPHVHNFGLHVHPDYRRHAARPGEPRLESPPVFTDDGFQVSLDVGDFYPREITVRTNESSRTITVEGNHEPRDEHGSDVERYFRRKFEMPKDIDLNSTVSAFSSDGILTVLVHKKTAKNERVVPILNTGPAHLWIKRVQHKG